MIRFFIDFDGTVTQNDVVDLILERYAASAWRETEKEWASGKIGSRECLTRQMALVSAPRERIQELLKDVKLDPGFKAFLKTARELEVPVTIVSDGFRFVIDTILKREFSDLPGLLQGLPVVANDFEWTADGPRAVFSQGVACSHGCANCKEKIIRQFAKPQDRTVFVGDGLSDRYAAKISDVVFAKSKLGVFCRENAIPYTGFNDFHEIEKWLVENQTKNTVTESKGANGIV